MSSIYSYAEDRSQASILDKTDWRRSIHKYMDKCVEAEDTVNYPSAVKSLVSAVSATFPKFNAKKLINDYLKQLNADYDAEINKFIESNPDYWKHPGKRLIIEPDIVNSYWKDVFEFIKNLLATRRMLLWGSKDLPGGYQMDDE